MLNNRLIWDVGTRLRHAADLTQPGLPPETVPEALSILRDEIVLLNRCLAELAPDSIPSTSLSDDETSNENPSARLALGGA